MSKLYIYCLLHTTLTRSLISSNSVANQQYNIRTLLSSTALMHFNYCKYRNDNTVPHMHLLNRICPL